MGYQFDTSGVEDVLDDFIHLIEELPLGSISSSKPKAICVQHVAIQIINIVRKLNREYVEKEGAALNNVI